MQPEEADRRAEQADYPVEQPALRSGQQDGSCQQKEHGRADRQRETRGRADASAVVVGIVQLRE